MLYVYSGCCGRTSTERRCRLSEYLADPSYQCPDCGAKLKQWVTSCHIGGGTKPFEAFKSPVDGSVITSKAALAEHNRRNNVVNIHDGYSEKEILGVTKKDIYKEINKDNDKQVKQDVAKSVNMLNNGYVPPPVPVEGEL